MNMDKITVKIPPILSYRFSLLNTQSILSFSIDGSNAVAKVLRDRGRETYRVSCPCKQQMSNIEDYLATFLDQDILFEDSEDKEEWCFSSLHCVEATRIAYYYHKLEGKVSLDNLSLPVETIVALHQTYYGGIQLHQLHDRKAALIRYIPPLADVRVIVIYGNSIPRTNRDLENIPIDALSLFFDGLQLSVYGLLEESYNTLLYSSMRIWEQVGGNPLGIKAPLFPLTNNMFISLLPGEETCTNLKRKALDEIDSLRMKGYKTYHTRLSSGGYIIIE